MNRIIGVSGWKRHGKDVVGVSLVTQGFLVAKFATPVYEGLYAMNPLCLQIVGAGVPDWDTATPVQEVVDEFGWEWAKDHTTVRDLLQKYGTEAGRNIHGQDCWVKAAWANLEVAVGNNRDIVFTDVRFKNEAHSITDRGGEIWRVIRPGAPVPGPDAHISETELDDWPFDVVLANDGTITDLNNLVQKHLDWMPR